METIYFGGIMGFMRPSVFTRPNWWMRVLDLICIPCLSFLVLFSLVWKKYCIVISDL